VCEEFCPVPQKAIKVIEKQKHVAGSSSPLVLRYPEVAEGLCIGCGICEAYCPVQPERAIVVHRT
jgi:formate hydrogenlyase subunit 6/NADH:ubiquinone oxidoreductase subunit I